MVNATYDSCEYLHSLSSKCRADAHAAGNLINNTLDENGQTGIYNMGDIAWVLTSMALAWMMIPGIGFFYSGLLRRKNALSMIYLSVVTLAVVSFQVCTHALDP